MSSSVVTQGPAGLNLRTPSLPEPAKPPTIRLQLLHHGVDFVLSAVGGRLAALQSADLTSLCRAEQATQGGASFAAIQVQLQGDV